MIFTEQKKNGKPVMLFISDSIKNFEDDIEDLSIALNVAKEIADAVGGEDDKKNISTIPNVLRERKTENKTEEGTEIVTFLYMDELAVLCELWFTATIVMNMHETYFADAIDKINEMETVIRTQNQYIKHLEAQCGLTVEEYNDEDVDKENDDDEETVKDEDDDEGTAKDEDDVPKVEVLKKSNDYSVNKMQKLLEQ